MLHYAEDFHSSKLLPTWCRMGGDKAVHLAGILPGGVDVAHFGIQLADAEGRGVVQVGVRIGVGGQVALEVACAHQGAATCERLAAREALC